MFFQHNGPAGRSGPIDTTLYEILGVSPSANDSEIKRAYHRLAKQYHPDKNPQHGEKFKEISFAYEILSNPEKKEMYDRRGLDGIKEGGAGGGMFPEDIFSHIFGGGGGGSPFGGGLFGSMFGGGGFGGPGRRRGPQKGQDTIHPLRVSLEDLYVGKTSKLQLSKQVICPTCKGLGGRDGATQACAACKGRGIKVTIRSLGPSMVQQMQSVCSDCRGQGSVIAEKDRCKVCSGKKTTKETKILEVQISPGMREGQRVTFRGEGDQEPDLEPGDVVIIIQQKEHEVFTRDGDNLFMKKSVTLAEALCGFHFVIRHLDGRNVVIRSGPGDVIDPGAVRGVVGCGMPRTRNPIEFGNLYISFDLEFPPDHFENEKKLKKLEKLLPPRPKAPAIPADHEEVSLMPYEERHSHGSEAGRKEAYHDDSDEEEHSHGQRVQCAHQ